MTDIPNEQLVANAQNGDESAVQLLVQRLMPVIKKSASVYDEPLFEFDDLVQEGRLAVFYAIKSYDSSKTASFKTYASVCIGNRLLNFIKAKGSRQLAAQKDFIPLNDEDLNLNTQGAAAGGHSPEQILIENESYDRLKEALKNVLSPLEHDVLDLYLCDMTYEEMSLQLKQPLKAIDNALQRVRKKLKSLLE